MKPKFLALNRANAYGKLPLYFTARFIGADGKKYGKLGVGPLVLTVRSAHHSKW